MGSIVAEIADKIASAGGGERSELEVRGGTGAAGGGILTLSTSELTVVDGDKLGRIDFQAPLDSAGTDAILVGASIWAESDNTFSASVNATELVFATGASEAATEKMRITSDGKVGIGTATPVTDLTIEGPITIKEQAAADADTAGYGQIWVDDAANSPLMYTNDAGADIGITTGSTLNAASLGGVMPVGVTGGSGLTDHARIGKSCRMYLTSSISTTSGEVYLSDYAMTTDYNDDASLYTPQTSATKSGIKILVTGMYAFAWSIYNDGGDTAGGYLQQFLAEVSGSNTQIATTYYILGANAQFAGSDWMKMNHCSILPITANQIISMTWNRQVGSIGSSGGLTTGLTATYLSN